MAKVLVTGGAGFIGSNLINKLYNKGYSDICVLDNLSTQIHGEEPQVTSPLLKSIAGKAELIVGDVNVAGDWHKALKGVDTVVHLAAETGTGQSMYEIKRYVDTNIGGTALLLDILTNTKHNVRKVIIASSRSIYGEGKYASKELGIVYPEQRLATDMDKGDFEVKYPGANSPLTLLPTDEGAKIHPSSIYGITKQNQEQMVMTACTAIGIGAVAFRYQNVYGPGQSLSNPYTGILSIFSTRILNGNGINIFEDGKESRDFVYIDDVVNATILGIESEKANGQVYNVGYGEPVDVLTVAQTLVNAYQKEVPLTITGNYRLGDIRHNYADLSKIREDLGFQPGTSFETGIRHFTKWVTQQEVKEDNYLKSLEEMKSKGLYK